MSKLLTGSRGGIYYKKNGRKVYVTQSSKRKKSKTNKGSFGEMKGVCKGVDKIPTMIKEEKGYGGPVEKWFNTIHLTDFFDGNQCALYDKSQYENPINCMNNYVALASKDWNTVNKKSLFTDLQLNIKMLNMLKIQLDPRNLNDDYNYYKLTTSKQKRKFKLFFEAMKNYMVDEVINSYGKFYDPKQGGFNFLEGIEESYMNNYNKPEILKEIPYVLFMLVIFKSIGYQECYLFPTLIFRIMKAKSFQVAENLQQIFKNEYNTMTEEKKWGYDLETPLISGGEGTTNIWVNDKEIGKGYYYCNFLRDLLETLDDIEIMNEPYLENLAKYANKYYPAEKSIEEYMGEFRGCIHDIIKECERLLGMNGRPRRLPSVIYVRGKEIEFIHKFITKEMIVGLIAKTRKDCSLLPTYIEKVMKKYYGFDFDKMDPKRRLQYYTYFKTVLESLLQNNDEHARSIIEGMLRNVYNIELDVIKMKKYIHCLDIMLTTINMLLRESLLEQKMNLNVNEPEKHVVGEQELNGIVQNLIINLYSIYFDECVKIFNYYKPELKYLTGPPKIEKYNEIRHITFQCITAQIEVLMNTIIERKNPTRKRHSNVYKGNWKEVQPMPYYKREIIPRSAKEDMINLARQILKWIITNRTNVGSIVDTAKKEKLLTIKNNDEKYFLLDFWRESLAALEAWADKKTVKEWSEERKGIQQKIEEQQAEEIATEIAEEEEYESDDEPDDNKYDWDEPSLTPKEMKGLPTNDSNAVNAIPKSGSNILSQLTEEEEEEIAKELAEELAEELAKNLFGRNRFVYEKIINTLITSLQEAKTEQKCRDIIDTTYKLLEKKIGEEKTKDLFKKNLNTIKNKLKTHKHWNAIEQKLMSIAGVKKKPSPAQSISKRLSGVPSFMAMQQQLAKRMPKPKTDRERIEGVVSKIMQTALFTDEERKEVVDYVLKNWVDIQNSALAVKNVMSVDTYMALWIQRHKSVIKTKFGIDLDTEVDKTTRRGEVDSRPTATGPLADALDVILANIGVEVIDENWDKYKKVAMSKKLRMPIDIIKNNLSVYEITENGIIDFVKEQLANGTFVKKYTEEDVLQMSPDELKKVLGQYVDPETAEIVLKDLESTKSTKSTESTVSTGSFGSFVSFGSIEERFYNGMSFGCYPFL